MKMTMSKKKGVAGYLGYGTGTLEPFDQVFTAGHYIKSGRNAHNDPGNQELFDEMNNVDALLIWGGEDISPSLYGESVASETHATENLSRRDMDEVRACLNAIDAGKPIIGICRGAQLLCALAGGKLVQHVSGHGMSHQIRTYDQKMMRTTSVHHQMMWPWAVKHRILAWADEKRSNVYVFNKEHRLATTVHLEPEVVWFPEIKGLAIQGHPEFVRDDQDEWVQWCMDQVRDLVFPEMTINATEK